MPKVLVAGDLIADIYRMHTSTRLCPEAPVPVLVAQKLIEQGTRPLSRRDGGAGLVANQLRQLIGSKNVRALFGSRSEKERIFADGKLICRIDRDSIDVVNRNEFHVALTAELYENPDMVIVSDYGKGAMDEPAIDIIMQHSRKTSVPVLVDAKNHWHFYKDAFALFPNKFERISKYAYPESHIIQKLGEHGCEVDGILVSPTRGHEVRDTTGAGDCFLAAFAAKWLETFNPKANFWQKDYPEEARLMLAARFANQVAGQSVEHLGTYIVPEKVDI